MKIDYTIIQPGFEFIPPPEPGKELEFLELCTRTCYKSEDHIKPGSAEKLLTKVVKDYNHLSVTEHASCIIYYSLGEFNFQALALDYVPLFAGRISSHSDGGCLVSGNIRMWKELVDTFSTELPGWNMLAIKQVLHDKWPFFFEEEGHVDPGSLVYLLDENPATNYNKLTTDEMLKHMTLTYRVIGDRSMSHQLVRHRLCAFSQESQRYCNYGKKGFQFVVPPSIGEDPLRKADFITDAVGSYQTYLRLIEDGVKPEDARGLLPNCTKTEVVVTSTLANWMHIFEHRAHNKSAQWQIKGIMQGIEKHMKSIVPEVFE